MWGPIAMIGAMRILRFLATGVVGLVVNLGSLEVFVTFFRLHYLVGSACAFTLALIVGFLLQKYWTFADHDASRVHTQFVQYSGIALTNLGLNTGGVYLLVEHAGVHYLLAQACMAGGLAMVSYLLYARLIFTRTA